MRLTPRTILGQLVAGTVVVQVLVFAIFLTFSVRHEYQHTRNRDVERIHKQTGIIAGLVAEPLVKEDPDLMDHVMHAIPIAASMKGARLTDMHGVVLRNTSNDLPMVLSGQELAMLPQLARNPGYRTITLGNGDLEGVQPVIADGLVRGVVWITQDTAFTLANPRSVIESLLIYSPFALVGNLLLVWALSGSLARPLRRLREASQRVRLDPNDLTAFPLPTSDNNEASELTASVNAMVDEIANQRRGTQDTLSLLDSMLSGAPIGFGFYDREYRYVRVNEHLAQMHGVPIEDHAGRHLRDLLPLRAMGMATRVEALIQRVFDTKLPASDIEISGYLHRDDAESAFRTSYFPVFAAGEVRWVGVIATDITEQQHAEAATRSSEKLATAGRLAASIASEISTPLQNVIQHLRHLRRNPSLNVEAHDELDLAEGEINRVGEITEHTLNIYRQPRAATEVVVPEVLRSVLSVYGARLQASGVELTLALDEEAVLFGYPAELRQLFTHLLRNAIDSIPRGGRLILRVHRARHGGVAGVRITVAQSGTPIPESTRRQILETVMEPEGGIHAEDADEVLSRHGGRVQVRGREARFRGDLSGTVFRFFFPVRGIPRGLFLVHSTPAPARTLAGQTV